MPCLPRTLGCCHPSTVPDRNQHLPSSVEKQPLKRVRPTSKRRAVQQRVAVLRDMRVQRDERVAGGALVNGDRLEEGVKNSNVPVPRSNMQRAAPCVVANPVKAVVQQRVRPPHLLKEAHIPGSSGIDHSVLVAVHSGFLCHGGGLLLLACCCWWVRRLGLVPDRLVNGYQRGFCGGGNARRHRGACRLPPPRCVGGGLGPGSR